MSVPYEDLYQKYKRKAEQQTWELGEKQREIDWLKKELKEKRQEIDGLQCKFEVLLESVQGIHSRLDRAIPLEEPNYKSVPCRAWKKTGTCAFGARCRFRHDECATEEQKQQLGEQIYPLVREIAPERAGKITGILLDNNNLDELLELFSPEVLIKKVTEADFKLEAQEYQYNKK